MMAYNLSLKAIINYGSTKTDNICVLNITTIPEGSEVVQRHRCGAPTAPRIPKICLSYE